MERVLYISCRPAAFVLLDLDTLHLCVDLEHT